jgi:ribonucleotide monophosphatase NagD (HAD superfamily)
MELRQIQLLISQQQYEVSLHAQQERLEENLDIEQIEEAIVQSGEILEQYPDDPRGESCLMLGFAGDIAIHVVLGWAIRKRDDTRVLRLITVYKPTLPKWIDPRTRGGRV